MPLPYKNKNLNLVIHTPSFGKNVQWEKQNISYKHKYVKQKQRANSAGKLRTWRPWLVIRAVHERTRAVFMMV